MNDFDIRLKVNKLLPDGDTRHSVAIKSGIAYPTIHRLAKGGTGLSANTMVLFLSAIGYSDEEILNIRIGDVLSIERRNE